MIPTGTGGGIKPRPGTREHASKIRKETSHAYHIE